MKIKIKDALQILAAILITGSTVASAAPLSTQASSNKVETSQVTQTSESQPAEKPATTSAEPSKIDETPKKVIVWQDNPNHCTDEEWIAKEKPFECIKKVTSASSAETSNQPVSVSGDKYDWLKASGIPQVNWWAVDYIVGHESGWNPCAYYPSQSNCDLTYAQINATGNGTACGLGMSLPCGKWGADWTDPVNQLKHMNEYVQKYGGWAGAVAYWKSYGNY